MINYAADGTCWLLRLMVSTERVRGSPERSPCSMSTDSSAASAPASWSWGELANLMLVRKDASKR